MKSAVRSFSSLILVGAIIFLGLATSTAAQTPSATPQTAETQSLMTNQDVIDLVAAGIPTSVIITKIKSSKTSFSTDLESLKALVAASVPEAVVSEMILKQEKDAANASAAPKPTNERSHASPNLPSKPVWRSSTGNLFHVTVEGDKLTIERVTVVPQPKEYHLTASALKQGEAFLGTVTGPARFWHSINPTTQQREIRKVCSFEDKIQVRFVNEEEIAYSIESLPDDTEYDESCKPNRKRKEWMSVSWKKLSNEEVASIFAAATDPANVRFATSRNTPRTLTKKEEDLRYKQQAQFLFNAPAERVLPLMVRAFQSWEYQIEQESSRRLVMSKLVRGLGNQVLAGLLVGNGAEAMFKIQVSLSEISGKTNVIINTSMGSQNLFGKVNFVSIDDRKDYRRQLDELMEQVRWYAESPR